MRYKKVRFFGCLLSLQEKWLNRMSQQGYHLINTSRAIYEFETCTPENPSLKDIGYVLGVQPFDCTPFYNASLDFADKTVKNFNFLFSGAIFMLDSFVNENLFNQSI